MSKAPTTKRVAIALPPEKRLPDPEAFVAAGKEALLPPADRPAAPEPSSTEEKVRLTIDIEKSLHKRLRVHAANDGRRLADIVRELLDEHIPHLKA